MLLDYEEPTHMYTHTLCYSNMKALMENPSLCSWTPRLPCLQGDVTQRGEMNWVNPTHRVGLTKQCRAEWWFIVDTVWPRNRVSGSRFRVHLGSRSGPTVALIHAQFWLDRRHKSCLMTSIDTCCTLRRNTSNVSSTCQRLEISLGAERRQPCWPLFLWLNQSHLFVLRREKTKNVPSQTTVMAIQGWHLKPLHRLFCIQICRLLVCIAATEKVYLFQEWNTGLLNWAIKDLHGLQSIVFG